MKRLLFALLFLVLLSCHHIVRGRVVSKNFRPAYWEWQMHYDPALKMSVSSWIYHPDIWSLLVNGVREDGKRDEDPVCVSHQDYEAFNEGDSIYFK